MCAVVALLIGCGADSESNDSEEGIVCPEPEVPLSLEFVDSTVDIEGIDARWTKNVAYGDGERNVFDIFVFENDEPTPLIIYIHGGGFTGGEKEYFYDNEDRIREILNQGVAVATINYHLLDVSPDTDQYGVIKSLEDSKRALQFMRYHASSFNIDPEKIAVYGGSAGAGTAIWLGTHNDMADASNEDPVLCQSTRINAVGALSTQSTYDIIDWEIVLEEQIDPLVDIGVFPSNDFVAIAQTLGQENLLLAFLGIDSVEEIDTAETIAYRGNIDMLDLMDSSDAPIYMQNSNPSISDPIDYMFHHSAHVIALKNRAEEVGLEYVAYYEEGETPVEDPSGEELIDFLVRHIQ